MSLLKDNADWHKYHHMMVEGWALWNKYSHSHPDHRTLNYMLFLDSKEPTDVYWLRRPDEFTETTLYRLDSLHGPHGRAFVKAWEIQNKKLLWK